MLNTLHNIMQNVRRSIITGAAKQKLYFTPIAFLYGFLLPHVCLEESCIEKLVWGGHFLWDPKSIFTQSSICGMSDCTGGVLLCWYRRMLGVGIHYCTLPKFIQYMLSKQLTNLLTFLRPSETLELRFYDGLVDLDTRALFIFGLGGGVENFDVSLRGGGKQFWTANCFGIL